MLAVIPHSFRSNSRTELVQSLQNACSQPQLFNKHGRNQRDIACELGLSESTWKRTRGIGSDWHKVDIYYLLKYTALYSDCAGIALLTPSHPHFKYFREPLVVTQDFDLSMLISGASSRTQTLIGSKG